MIIGDVTRFLRFPMVFTVRVPDVQFLVMPFKANRFTANKYLLVIMITEVFFRPFAIKCVRLETPIAPPQHIPANPNVIQGIFLKTIAIGTQGIFYSFHAVFVPAGQGQFP